LSNAIKFSKAHDAIKVDVTTEVALDFQKSRKITIFIKVTDKGIGISS